MILDSTFLVDLERATLRGRGGSALEFLKKHKDERLRITFTIAGELAAGASLGKDRDRWRDFLSPFEILGSNADVAWLFGAIYRDLKARGELIGANDLWIAATAIAYSEPLVTRNHEEFRRVKQLQVFDY